MDVRLALSTKSFRQLSHPPDSTQESDGMAMAAGARRHIPTALSSLILLIAVSLTSPAAATDAPPTPAPWPHQFHAVLFRNHSGSLALIDLWYDWPNGRNFNIIRDQLGAVLRYDLEWNNGTSFYYTLGASPTCLTVHFDVGILRPNWLDGAEYLGRQRADGFLCDVWRKVDFIWYYEDVATRRPVRWVFYTGRSVHVMTFEVGAALEDAKWQAPAYCFEKGEGKREPETQVELGGDAQGMLLLQTAEPERKRFPGFSRRDEAAVSLFL